MGIAIQEINQDNLQDVERCDSTFTVDSKLVLAAENDVVEFGIVGITPYQKTYPSEAIDSGAYIDNPDRTIFFAYVDRAIAGQIRLRRNWNQYAYIEDIVVDAKFRRRGIGRALIQHAVHWAKDKQLAGVMLETQNTNVAACLLYQSCGFEVGGFDRLLYQGLDPDTQEVAVYWYLLFRLEQE